MPVYAIVIERNLAPARMNMIMHDTLVAPIRLSLNEWRSSHPPHQANAIEIGRSVRHRHRKELGAVEDEHDHARHPCLTHQAFPERMAIERSAPPGQCQ